jgi:ABC-2 type transport system ATP-binding protein
VTDVRAVPPGPAGAPGAATETGAPADATAGPAASSPAASGPAATGHALAVSTSGLTKRFRGGQVAVDHIDLAVPRGAVYGFLGPNGSGKTTTIRMLLGLAFPTSGRAELLGVPMPEGTVRVLPHVGSLIEGPAFYPFLNGRDNLARCDAADRTADPRTAADRINGALDRVGLLAAAGKRYRNYSLGMKQRLAIAAGLLTPRQLIILDEPTNGLDPQGTREVRALIREIAADGITVFVSSHLLAEVEQVCSHVGVMRTGRLVFQGSLEELRRTGADPGADRRSRRRCRRARTPRAAGPADRRRRGHRPARRFFARTDLCGACPRRGRGPRPGRRRPQPGGPFRRADRRGV